MSEMKHTPGPWKWYEEDYGMLETYSLGPGVLTTEYSDGTPWGDEIDKANARLIAAAPDLLEALSAIINHNDDVPAWSPLLDRARAAVAKAEGKP